MNQERLQLKGYISELKQKQKELKIQISGLVTQIRLDTPTYLEPVEINSERVLLSAEALNNKVKELKEVSEKLSEALEQL